MDKKLLKQIHSILLPLWQSYTAQDIWQDFKAWNINKAEALRRIKIIQEDFKTEAEYKLFTDQQTSIEELAELVEECENNNSSLDDEPIYKKIRAIITEYSKAYLEVVFDAGMLEEGEYMASECGEECPPGYIQERIYDEKMTKIAQELGARGGGESVKKRLKGKTKEEISEIMKKVRKG